MTAINVLKYPHSFLRTQVEPIDHFDKALRSYAASMFETMYQEHGCGLAATQVHYPGRIIVVDISKDRSGALCLVNPEILSADGNYAVEEGCLSIPGVFAKVPRAKNITVQYRDLHGQAQELQAADFLAICIQHEIDHLNGVLFFDHLSALKRERLLKKYEKLQQETL